MSQPEFGLGITAFSINPGVNAGNLDTTLDTIDSLELPRHKTPAIEFLLCHSPELSLDDKSERYLTWAQELGKKVRARGYKPIFDGFHPNGSKAHLLSEYEEERELAVSRIVSMIRFTAAAGSDLLIGPFHVEHGRRNPEGQPDSNKLVEPLKRIAKFAKSYKVNIAPEMIVAFESDALNSSHTAERVMRKVDYKNAGIHADTAHMLREELNPIGQTLEKLYAEGKGILKHIHFSSGDRGPITRGRGEVARQLPEIVGDLISCGYGRNGEVVGIECFHHGLWPAVARENKYSSPNLADGLALREARDTVNFVKSVMSNYNKGR